MLFIKISKQSWIQLCLLIVIILLNSACHFNKKSEYQKDLTEVAVTLFSIGYSGMDDFKHGDQLSINGKIFLHDSLYLFKKGGTGDTAWLPSKKYVAKKSENGRLLYDYITPIAILMKINDKLANDTVHCLVNAGNLLNKGELIINLKKEGIVKYSRNYPLRIQSIGSR